MSFCGLLPSRHQFPARPAALFGNGVFCMHSSAPKHAFSSFLRPASVFTLRRQLHAKPLLAFSTAKLYLFASKDEGEKGLPEKKLISKAADEISEAEEEVWEALDEGEEGEEEFNWWDEFGEFEFEDFNEGEEDEEELEATTVREIQDADVKASITPGERVPTMPEPFQETASPFSFEYLDKDGETPLRKVLLTLSMAVLDTQASLNANKSGGGLPIATNSPFFQPGFFDRLREAAPQDILDKAQSRANAFDQAALVLALALPTANFASDQFAHFHLPWLLPIFLSLLLFFLGRPFSRLYGFSSAPWDESCTSPGFLGYGQFKQNVDMLKSVLVEAQELVSRKNRPQ